MRSQLMCAKKLKHIQINDDGTFYYDSGMKQWSKEEVEQIDKEYFDNTRQYIEMALADGFIEFPIMWDNGPDDVQWSSCYLPPNFMPSHAEGYKERYGMNYNIYIPSYGRAGDTYTDKVLDTFGIENYYFCVDPDQYPAYKEAYGKEKVIIRDYSFKKKDKTNRMSSVNAPHYLIAGSAFMNALLYMTKSLGDDRYWMLDDDLYSIGLKAPKGNLDLSKGDFKYNKDDFLRCSFLTEEYIDFDFKAFLCDLEEFAMQSRNLSAIALDKYGLVFTKPIGIDFGSRAYSFFLADANLQLDERGFQNNDTINSIDAQRQGQVVAIVHGYYYHSFSSQSQSGGCTGAYTSYGTLDKGKSLVAACPNNSKISFLFSRIHHSVDYSIYNKNRLVGKAKID